MQRDPPVGAGPSPRPRLQVEGRLRALSLMARGAALYFGRTSPRLPSTHYHGLRLTTRLARIRSYLVRDPVYSFGVQVGVGVLVCEALRERSEQRANSPDSGWRTNRRVFALYLRPPQRPAQPRNGRSRLIVYPLRYCLPLAILDLVEVQVVATLVLLCTE